MPTAATLSRGGQLALLAPPTLFLLILFVQPVAAIVWRGLAPDGLGRPHRRRRRADEPRRCAGWCGSRCGRRSLSTALTLALGLPGAYALSRLRFRGRRTVSALVLVPFVLPTVVVGSAFLALLGPRSPINSALTGALRRGGADARPAADRRRHPPRPRVLQLRGGRPHRRRSVGEPRPAAGGRRSQPRRVALARGHGRSPSRCCGRPSPRARRSCSCSPSPRSAWSCCSADRGSPPSRSRSTAPRCSCSTSRSPACSRSCSWSPWSPPSRSTAGSNADRWAARPEPPTRSCTPR